MDSSEFLTCAEFRRWRRGALAGFLALTLGIGAALTTKPDTGALRAGLISSCQRVNILRAQSNMSDLVSFRILSLSAQREMKLSKGDPKNKRIHRNNATSLRIEAQRLTITALTECEPAVDDAKAYKFPIASSIGNVETGTVDPIVQLIVKDSERLLRRQNG